jgi:hypothetical protein
MGELRNMTWLEKLEERSEQPVYLLEAVEAYRLQLTLMSTGWTQHTSNPC